MIGWGSVRSVGSVGREKVAIIITNKLIIVKIKDFESW